MVITPVIQQALCNFLYEKGQNIWLEKAKSSKNASEIRHLKSDRADASMTGVNAMRSHDMTVMYEPLSKPQSQLCKLSLQADSGKAQVQFSDAQGREETDHGETTIKTML